jgi:hypothetical protein
MASRYQHRIGVCAEICFDRTGQSKHMVDRLNPQPSVTSPLDQQILRRPVFGTLFRADYCRLARHAPREACSKLRNGKPLERQGAPQDADLEIVTTDTMHVVQFQLAGGVALSFLYSALA